MKVSCFVRLAGPDTKLQKLPGRTVQRGDLVTAQLSPKAIETVANRGPSSGIAYIEMGEPLSLPHPVVTARRASEPTSRAPELAGPGVPPQVLIGIVDVGGFDFTHPDFLDAHGGTRYVRIWDQGAPKRSPLGKPPRPFGYGAELTHERMQQALDWSRTHAIGATDLLRAVRTASGRARHPCSEHRRRQSGRLSGRGDRRRALIALSEQERDRHATLYDSTRLAHAVDYLFGLGERLYGRSIPTVVNISLGTNGHAHDGTSAICRWIDAALMTPGRCVCVAAGNAGQEAPQFAGDLGFSPGAFTRADTSRRAASKRSRMASRRQRDRRCLGERAGDLVRSRRRVRSAGCVRRRVSGSAQSGPALMSRTVGSKPRLSCRIYNERYHPANGANEFRSFSARG